MLYNKIGLMFITGSKKPCYIIIHLHRAFYKGKLFANYLKIGRQRLIKVLIFINADMFTRKEGLIEYCVRGHQFGDGVFEIVPVYNGKVFGMIPHMENLFTSVTRLKIPAVYMVEELVEFHVALIKATGMENGEIYTHVTRGSAPFWLAFRK